jgi:hypothetical protein
MKQLLEQLEKRLQTLVESTIMVFPWGQTQKSVAISLINALRVKLISSSDSEGFLPNVFTIKLNPDIYEILSSDSKWIEEVKQVLTDTASESGFHFSGPLSLELMPAEGYQQQQYELSAFSISNKIEQTAILKIDPQKNSLPVNKTKKAFLMLQNQEIFHIDRGIIQIGRKKDNHLIIDDPTISRNHAQIRYIQNNYVIFDLNSTGGTFVNNKHISQSALYPGDVIKLAEYVLIYGEEQAGEKDFQDQTTELPRTVDPS